MIRRINEENKYVFFTPYPDKIKFKELNFPLVKYYNNGYKDILDISYFDPYYRNLDYIFENKLISRENWILLRDLNVEYINFCYMGVDISSKNKKSEISELITKNNPTLLEAYEKKLYAQKRTIPEKGSAYNRSILKKSQISNRLSGLTKVTGDKNKFYNLIKSYSKTNKFIPESLYVDKKDPEYFANINKFLSKKDENSLWIIKPAKGSLGRGIKILNKEELLQSFDGETSKEFDKRTYSEWIISSFVKSFLWKNTYKRDSLRLCDKIENYTFPDGVKHGLWNDATPVYLYKTSSDSQKQPLVGPDGNQYAYKKQINPSYSTGKNGETKHSKKYKPFREFTFNDKYGRVNKGRLWFLVYIQNNQLCVCVYNKLFFDLCAYQYEKKDDYKDISKIFTDINGQLYTNEFKLDDTNALRASYMDLCFTVDWETGKFRPNYFDKKLRDFPVDWTKVKQNISNFLSIFHGAIKNKVRCISEINFDPKFEKFGCFQYFALDFIVDKNADVWVLELNTRPWVGVGDWWKSFDSDYAHVNNKYDFVENIVRKFIDPFFHPEKKPVDQLIGKLIDIPLKDNSHEYLTKDDFVILKNTIMYDTVPNAVKNKQLHRALYGRGIGTFPYGNYAELPPDINPLIHFKGISVFIKYLIEKYSDSRFKEKMKDFYPELYVSKLLDRIFPFFYYLGNKKNLLVLLRDTFPTGTKGMLSWDQILPPTFEINKSELHKLKGLISVDHMWIVKPNEGKQGKGILISNSYREIEQFIKHNKEYPDEDIWVISKYIENPLILQERKSHIRVFVLVHSKKECIKIYTLEKHFIFLAPIPYNQDKADAFVNDYFKDEYIELFQTGELSDYKNITNLDKSRRVIDVFFKDKLSNEQKRKSIKGGTINAKVRAYIDSTNKEAYKNPGYDIFSGNPEDPQYYLEKEKYTPIKEQINLIIEQTILAAKPKIVCTNKSDNCYHYLAFDFLVDSDNKPWLLEVNTLPGLNAVRYKMERKGGITGFFNSIFEIVLDKVPKIVGFIKKGNDVAAAYFAGSEETPKNDVEYYYVPSKFKKVTNPMDLWKEKQYLVRRHPNMFQPLSTIKKSNTIQKMTTVGKKSSISEQKKYNSILKEKKMSSNVFQNMIEMYKKMMLGSASTQVEMNEAVRGGLPLALLASKGGKDPFDMVLGAMMLSGMYKKGGLYRSSHIFKDIVENFMSPQNYMLALQAKALSDYGKGKKGLFDTPNALLWLLIPSMVNGSKFGNKDFMSNMMLMGMMNEKDLPSLMTMAILFDKDAMKTLGGLGFGPKLPTIGKKMLKFVDLNPHSAIIVKLMSQFYDMKMLRMLCTLNNMKCPKNKKDIIRQILAYSSLGLIGEFSFPFANDLFLGKHTMMDQNKLAKALDNYLVADALFGRHRGSGSSFIQMMMMRNMLQKDTSGSLDIADNAVKSIKEQSTVTQSSFGF